MAFTYSYHMLVVVSLVVLVRVSSVSDECPPWFILQQSNDSYFPQCVCNNDASEQIICYQKERTSFLKLGNCAFQDETINATVVGGCPYLFPGHLIDDGLIRLPHNTSQLNNFICGHLKREITAPFCGRCTNGTGPTVYSFGSQCVSCRSVNILYYVLLQYVPTTIIFLLILLFRFDIVSPPMAHYVLYCNLLVLVFRSNIGIPILQVALNVYPSELIRLVVTLNAIWTIDTLYFVSPPLCISESIQEIYIPVFDAIAALYPFILLLLTYFTIELYGRDFKPIVVVWKLFYRSFGRYLKSWSSDKSLIRTFATLFYLSFTKFVIVVIESFLLSYVASMEGDVGEIVLYIDPTVTYFSQKHICLIIISIFILLFIISPPILLLLIYPTTCFRKFSTCLKPRWILTLQIFADTFQGCYKNGTNGTRDYRQMASYILPLWIVCPILFLYVEHIISNHTLTWMTVAILMSMTLGVAVLVLEPYQKRTANISGTIVFFFIALGTILCKDFRYKNSTSTEFSLVFIAFSTIPHCVFYCCIIYHVIKKLRRYATTLHGEDGVLHGLVVNRDCQ